MITLKESLSADAALLRTIYLKKPFPSKNVAVVELHLKNGRVFGIGATSGPKKKNPLGIDIPKPKSQGGQFEPIVDSHSGYLMNTDSEYKALCAIADTLDMFYDSSVEGKLYLYTERRPCESCQEIVKQFKEKFSNIDVEVFWDYPYP
ncbi:hypothetical protein PCC7424_4045 [Gloeothece citriformis PCC 7424]|uniref:CMP/dCMP deaminase zinc-binding n=1 Tax=Gloeothece citriformis (strain PCC 7424) TaxID=65393 RepID=B7KL47_GLOC7|nr:deaminase domain-containing protein [Gloeothece citriformis]ACK72419.1 hypothetical protein PCC7424_4045 [Gloeothece citriformis PCC 7424]